MLRFVAVCDSCFCPSNFVQPDLRSDCPWMSPPAACLSSAGFVILPPIPAAASRLQLCLADTTSISRSCFTAVIVDNCGNTEQYSSSEVPLRSIDAPHRPGGILLCIRNSVRAANQSAPRFIPFNGSLCLGTIGKLAGHQNTCERDTSRNRACTAVQGRFCNPPGAHVGIGRATCARRKS